MEERIRFTLCVVVSAFAQVTPWLPINSNYLSVNVESENSTPTSSLNLYKAMVALRQSDETFNVRCTSRLMSILFSSPGLISSRSVPP